MADFTVEKHGDWISIADADGARLSFTPAEAEQVAFQLLGAVALVRSTMIDEAQTAIRRGQQQIVTALQEVARKVARHEQLAVTTSVTIEPNADLEHALEAAGQILGELRKSAGAAIRC